MIKTWNNPFQQSKSIVSFSSGVAANSDVEHGLPNAEKVGQAQLEEFVSLRIELNKVRFYERIKKKKLLTFDATVKKCVVKVKGNIIAIKADRETCARLLIIQGSRGNNIREVLQYELSSTLLSLANPDATLRKTVKSKLFQFLVQSITTVLTYPNNTPAIFDGMVLLKKFPLSLKTFGKVSDYLLKKIVNSSYRISLFITDHYLPNSIKSMDRERTSGIGLLRITASRRDQAKPK